MSAKVSVRPRYKQVLKGYEENAKKIVGYGLQEIRGIAVKGILAGNKSGRTYTRGNITHTASAAGEYPASDTGFLANNIHISRSPSGLSGAVESRAKYSEALEFGTSKMAARPFLQPSAEEVRPKIRRKIRELF
jgi:HK97 gp10 family phage protein